MSKRNRYAGIAAILVLVSVLVVAVITAGANGEVGEVEPVTLAPDGNGFWARGLRQAF